jgi:hypothetical protein
MKVGKVAQACKSVAEKDQTIPSTLSNRLIVAVVVCLFGGVANLGFVAKAGRGSWLVQRSPGRLLLVQLSSASLLRRCERSSSMKARLSVVGPFLKNEEESVPAL